MAGPDFSSVGAELQYWFAHIGQTFKGGYSGSGENGVDIGMPTGTPVYAVAPGTIVGHGYYAGGGVVSIKEQPGRVWYYQHLDLAEPGIESGQVKEVQAGQLIGWSGGQSGYGRHPVSDLRLSNDGHGHGWPHIEVGINAPWGGIWGPMSDKGPNVDPRPYLQQIAQTGSAGTTGTPSEPIGGATTATLADGGGGIATCAQYNPLDPRRWVCVFTQQFKVLTTWLSDPLRILKLIGGAAAIWIAAQITLTALTMKAAPTALQVAGTATGQPEVALAGSALKGGASAKTRTRAARGLSDAPRRRQAQQEARDTRQQAVGAERERASAAAKRRASARKGAATRQARAARREEAS